jgi:dipeptidyl aminopeptidase/acylaminoacyl peptidase
MNKPSGEYQNNPRPKRRRSRWRLALLCVIAIVGILANIALNGCASWIAHGIVDAPNQGKSIDQVVKTKDSELSALGVTRSLRIDVGPPAASLSCWVIDPPGSPRGVILVLHGVRDQKRSQLSLGKMLANAGYRAVLIDLRGHGESTGDWLTYGVVDSHDLVQVIDALEKQNLITGPIGAMSASYGASVAIQAAAIDPRVESIVAIAPFTSLSDVVPHYVRHYGFGWLIPKRKIAEGIALTGQLATFGPQQASPLRAIANTNAHELLIHGKNDHHIPCEHSQRLSAAASDRTKLILIDAEDHDSIMSDRTGIIARETLVWFELWLK